jgi:hypothetical protein
MGDETCGWLVAARSQQTQNVVAETLLIRARGDLDVDGAADMRNDLEFVAILVLQHRAKSSAYQFVLGHPILSL